MFSSLSPTPAAFINAGLFLNSSSCWVLLHCALIRVSEEVKKKMMLQLDPLLNLLELGSLAHKEACVGEWAHFRSLPTNSYLMK